LPEGHLHETPPSITDKSVRGCCSERYDIDVAPRLGANRPEDERSSSLIEKAKQWARAIKRDVMALWLAARDPRVPWLAKAVAGAVAAYALSPIDLIPDFIPVLGYVDDLVIVPIGILLAVELVPRDLMAELRTEAARQAKPVSKAGLAVVIAAWSAAGALSSDVLWTDLE
jgi:uncharacterized membrane protein YkvA (DUF1232 family)